MRISNLIIFNYFNTFSAITKNFGSPILFPVVWLDEGLELNEEMTGMIKRDLTNVLLILDIVQWTFGNIIEDLLFFVYICKIFLKLI